MALTEARIEFDPAGVPDVDAVLLEGELSAWSVVEDVIAKRAWLVGLFEEDDAARRAWGELAPLVAAWNPRPPAFSTLADADWKDSYKAHFHAWQFGPLHWVPVWERETFRLPPGHRVLWLDPGLAFGTGNHETTRLCCERLVAWAAAAPAGARRVIDAGCGSGILALSAALLECGPIEAFDIDEEAVRVSRENAALNGLEGSVEFGVAGLQEGLANSSAELVLANIQADVLMRHAAELTAAVADGGTLVLSGILAAELPQVRAAFELAAPKWAIDSRTMGEWSDLCLRRHLPGS